MKIALFISRFNPATKYVVEVAKKIKEDYSLDRVILSITDNISYPEYLAPPTLKQREEILKLTIKDLGYEKLFKTRISKLEIGFSIIHEILLLNLTYPNDELTVIVDLEEFKDDDFFKNPVLVNGKVSFICLRDSSFKATKKLTENIDRFEYNVSNSVAKESIINYELWERMSKSAIKYIASNYLYINRLALENETKDRLLHTLSVNEYAIKLSKNNYGQQNIASFAALAHDISKDDSIIRQAAFLGPRIKEFGLPQPAYHGFTIATWLEGVYGLNDVKIGDAIRKHTLASDKMSTLDKLLFVADKIADNRKEKNLDFLRELAFNDLDKAFEKALNDQVLKLKFEGKELHPWTLAAYNKYVLGDKW